MWWMPLRLSVFRLSNTGGCNEATRILAHIHYCTYHVCVYMSEASGSRTYPVDRQEPSTFHFRDSTKTRKLT